MINKEKKCSCDNFIESLLASEIISRLLLISDLIESGFESIPMLAIQFTNNQIREDGWTVFS